MGSIIIDDNYDKCRRILKESISGKRYLHSLGVSNTAACLAMRYESDCKRAYIAGLLHDCAKGLKDEQLVGITLAAGLEVTDVEKEYPELLHAKAGSILAKDRYGADDTKICSAIRYHTTGRPDMTLLEKIIFVADYIEPNRCNLPELDRIRHMAFTDIDAAVALICKNTLDHLKSSAKAIDPATVFTYEHYRDHLKDHAE